MKKTKKLLLALFVTLTTVFCCFAVAGCGVDGSASTGSSSQSSSPSSAEHQCAWSERVADHFLKTAATCTEKAVYYKSCECGAINLETFEYGEALGHTGGTATCAQKAVCTRCQTEYGELKNHNIIQVKKKEPSCSSGGFGAYEYCDGGCGYTTYSEDLFIGALGHSGGVATCEEDGICTVCGTHYIEKLTHLYARYNYVAPSCTEDGQNAWEYCYREGCDYTTYDENTVIPALGHEFTDYVSVGDASCTVDGTKRAMCNHGCGLSDMIIDVGSALGHEFTDYVSVGDATCTEDGTKRATCNHGCGKSDVIADVGSALDHDLIQVGAKAPNCFEYGWDEYEYCNRESCSYTTYYWYKIHDALGHSYTNYSSDGNATCTEDGTKTAVCDNGCGTKDTVTDTWSALGHSHTNYISDGNATCTQDGTKTAVCDNGCGLKNTIADDKSALGHEFTTYVSNKDATCTKDGTKTANCNHGCGTQDTVTESGSMLKHTYVDLFCKDCEELQYKLNYVLSADETYYIVDGIGECTETDVIIVSEYKGKPVKQVDGLSASDNVTSVTIPETVVSINGMGACNNLASIIVHEDNEYYQTKDGVLYTKDGKTLITYPLGKTTDTFTIPDGVETIAERAFSGCTYLKTLTIPESVISIGKVALRILSLETLHYNAINCADYDWQYYHSVFRNAGTKSKGIEVIVGVNVKRIPANLFRCSVSPDSQARNKIVGVTFTSGSTCETIGSNAFNGCDLTQIKLPGSIKTIEAEAFLNCYKLVEVYDLTTLGITLGKTDNGYVAYYAKDVYTSSTESSKITCTDGGFVYHTGSEHVTLLSYNGLNAEVTIPYYITAIQPYALYNNLNITSLTIQTGVTVIGESAFSDCNYLMNISLPKGITRIGKSAFYSARYTSYYANNWIDGMNYIGDYLLGVYGNAPATLKIKDGTTCIADCAAYGKTNISSVEIPSSVQYIGSEAFYGCRNMQSVTMKNVKRIEDWAFSSCVRMTSIELPDSIESIGYRAFYNCYGLTSITMGAALKSIGNLAFEGCFRLIEVYNRSSMIISLDSVKNIYTPTSGNSKLTIDENGYILYTDGDNVLLLEYTGGETSLILPSGITEIYKYAFYASLGEETGLKSVVIPNTVKHIGDWAFSGCRYLTSIIIPDSVTSIGRNAFEYCLILDDVIIGGGVETIGDYAFFDCVALKDITVSNSIKSIGISVFVYCENLTELSFGGTMDEWNAIEKSSDWKNGSALTTIVCTDGEISLSAS